MSVNFYDPATQTRALEIIERDEAKTKCPTCRQSITSHVYIEQVKDEHIKVSAHCGGDGHNLHVFTLTEADFR